jgi:hypothetical protein
MDQLGQAVNASACAGLLRPAEQLQCNVLPCDFCATTDCAQQARPDQALHALHVMASGCSVFSAAVSSAARTEQVV